MSTESFWTVEEIDKYVPLKVKKCIDKIPKLVFKTGKLTVAERQTIGEDMYLLRTRINRFKHRKIYQDRHPEKVKAIFEKFLEKKKKVSANKDDTGTKERTECTYVPGPRPSERTYVPTRQVGSTTQPRQDPHRGVRTANPTPATSKPANAGRAGQLRPLISRPQEGQRPLTRRVRKADRLSEESE